jgi:general L-amino acid transport system permease protein
MATELRRPGRRPPPATITWSLSDPFVRGLLYQVILVGVVTYGIYWLAKNTAHNLEIRKIASGWGFLGRESGIPIGDSPFVEWGPERNYLTALWVGLLNTLRVAVVGVILATILGTLLGIARLSRNWLLARLAKIYVELMRNLPLLLQLFFWWTMFILFLPEPRSEVQILPSVFLTKSGLMYPGLAWDSSQLLLVAALALAIAATIGVARWAKQRQEQTGQTFPVAWTALGLIVGVPIVAAIAFQVSLDFDLPVQGRFRMTGGATISPELAALTIGLVTYTAAFIAEIVRAGILAIPKGQWEASGALGLSRGRLLQLVVLPQALRVIVPPMTSQYLNITKNSSLAVAIGYQEIVSVANTTMNQTGQAIEGVAIIMAVYLSISLSISLFMNWYNKHIALVER